jgi:uncharacterized membrane protein (DUF485 family)
MDTNGHSRSDSARLEPDWDAIAESPEFLELLRSRRRFVVPATTFFFGYFVTFLCLLAWAPDTMAKQVIGSVSIALVAGVSVVAVGFTMTWLYTRHSAEWGAMSERVAAGARRPSTGGAR